MRMRVDRLFLKLGSLIEPVGCANIGWAGDTAIALLCQKNEPIEDKDKRINL